jgi:hypothetical protein
MQTKCDPCCKHKFPAPGAQDIKQKWLEEEVVVENELNMQQFGKVRVVRIV